MSLRQKLRHIRAKDKDGNILSKGGATISAIVDDNDKVAKFAVAWCHSRDNFSRHIGKVKATGMMNSDNAVSGASSQSWDNIVNGVTTEVNRLHREALAREMEKLDNKRNVIERRISTLSKQYQNV